MNRIRIVEAPPSVEDYNRIRAAVGWGALEPSQIETALANSRYAVCAYIDDEIAGCARIVGDGAMFFYIQDMMILPEFQRGGVGSELMQYIGAHLERTAPQNSFIGLMAARDAAPFYEKHGIPKRLENSPGMGAWKNDRWPGPTFVGQQ